MTLLHSFYQAFFCTELTETQGLACVVFLFSMSWCILLRRQFQQWAFKKLGI